MNEKISVVTISYNSEKTIEKTLKSILFQSYRPLEYILVDGGSKDETINLIQKYIPMFNEMGIEINFKSEPDQGISDAFNKGIERSTGEIVGIINSDDCLEREAINIIAENLDNDVDVLFGDCMWIDETQNMKYIRKSTLDLEKLKYDMVIMHPTCFVRKSAYEKWGKFDTSLKYVMDKDLMARFYRMGANFSYIPEIIATMSAGGVSDLNAKKVFEEGIEVAIRNGVPQWRATILSKYKGVRYDFINTLKKSCLANIFYKINDVSKCNGSDGK